MTVTLQHSGVSYENNWPDTDDGAATRTRRAAALGCEAGARVGRRANDARASMVRGSKGQGNDVPACGEDSAGGIRAAAQIPARQACTSMTRVMWRYQAVKLRTS